MNNNISKIFENHNATKSQDIKINVRTSKHKSRHS